jgi:hypothetical protein
MTEADALADLDRALMAAEAVMAGIGAGEWTAPTPCTELDVRGVLNHLVSGSHTGQPADFPDDVAARALAATRRQLTSRPDGPGAPFAAEVQVPEGARAVDRLAGFLGRPV